MLIACGLYEFHELQKVPNSLQGVGKEMKSAFVACYSLLRVLIGGLTLTFFLLSFCDANDHDTNLRRFDLEEDSHLGPKKPRKPHVGVEAGLPPFFGSIVLVRTDQESGMTYSAPTASYSYRARHKSLGSSVCKAHVLRLMRPKTTSPQTTSWVAETPRTY